MDQFIRQNVAAAARLALLADHRGPGALEGEQEGQEDSLRDPMDCSAQLSRTLKLSACMDPCVRRAGEEGVPAGAEGLAAVPLQPAYVAAAEGCVLGALRLDPILVGLGDAYKLLRWVGWAGGAGKRRRSRAPVSVGLETR